MPRIELGTSSLPRKRSTTELHRLVIFLSGRPGSNRRHSAWKADALPTELLPHFSFNNLRLNLLELNLNIKIVKSNKLLNLRSKILRNNMNPSKCIYRGDYNKTSFHIGAYIDGILVGGVSIIKNKCVHKDFPDCYQLRGLFVDFNHQKKGIGKMIIKKVEFAKEVLDLALDGKISKINKKLDWRHLVTESMKPKNQQNQEKTFVN